ncbi:InlB B-repeat-containing protein [Fenollaria sporofastidiosus]|uniref:InlB B-repeat-containing protein n=1 Tax=Fenollaria sporofastidiosus TaxID=2811778 RepID=UPI001C003B7C|nr:S-layer homology domain-containing protein [Fenollaria sporofastidiosus]
MKKRLLSLLLVMMMLITAMPLAAAQSTNNYKVDWLVQNNIVQGRGDGELSLGKNITRAEFTKMVLAVTGELNQANLYAAASAFKDVNNHWAKNIISYATQRGYLAGYQDGSFRPNAHIKLDECIAILARLNPDFAEPKVKTGYWAQAYIDYAKTSGILNGIANTNNLKTFATRETAFNMVYNEVQVYTFVNKKIAEEARRLLEEDAAKKEEEAREEEARQAEARKARERKERRERQERREREERLDRYYRIEYNVYFNLGSGYEFKDRVIANTFYKLPLAPSIAPSGKKFKAWNVNGAEYMAEAYVYVDIDLYISPVWENIPTPPTPEPPTPPTPTKYKVTATKATADPTEAEVGAEVKIKADEAEEGQEFAGWEVTGITLEESQKTSKEITITMPANAVTIKATFKDKTVVPPTPTKYKVTATKATADPTEAEAGAEVKIKADEAEEGQEFAGWEVTGITLEESQKTSKEITITMPANAVTIKATFKDKTVVPPTPTKYKVTATKATADPTEAEAGAEVKIKADEAEEGQEFAGWEVTGITLEESQKTSKEITITMPANAVTIKATFKDKTVVPPTPTKYKVTATKATADPTEAEAGAEVKIKADEAEEGQEFAGWEVTGITLEESQKTSKEITITMPANAVTIKATFKDKTVVPPTPTKYKVTATKATADPTEAEAGAEVKIKADEAEEGQEFAGWEVTGITLEESQKTSKEITITMPANAVTIRATFKDKEVEKVFGIEKISSNVGTFTVSLDDQDIEKAKAGETIKVKADVPGGYKLIKISVAVKEIGKRIELLSKNEEGSIITFKMPDCDIQIQVLYCPLESKIKNQVFNQLKEATRELKNNFTLDIDLTEIDVKDFEGEVMAGFNDFNAVKEGTYLDAILSGFSYGSKNPEDQIKNHHYIDVNLSYTHTKEQEAKVDNYVSKVISERRISEAETDYEKVKAVHDYIITNAAYFKLTSSTDKITIGLVQEGNEKFNTVNGVSVHSPYALCDDDNEKNVGVCQAYAGLFQKFMDKLNIKCHYATGYAGEKHAWNIVEIGKKYYNIDLTFDDPANASGEQQGPKSGLENYEYFLRGDRFFNNPGKDDIPHTRNNLKDITVQNEDYEGRAKGYLDKTQNANQISIDPAA